MSAIEKLVKKARTSPQSIRFEELEKILNYGGYSADRQKGSHVCFRNESGDVITIPKRDPVKVVYVIETLERINVK